MKYQNIREEELKTRVGQDYFWQYDYAKVIGNVDFCVSMHHNENLLFEQESLLWAEAKTGSSEIYKSITQLILTIGKARTFDKYLPPSYLGAFDSEKIAFVPYNDIVEIFYLNDFNWNVAPSNYETKEFQLIQKKVEHIVESKILLFHYEQDNLEIEKFIKNNFIVGKFGVSKTKIDKNNFMIIYNKWLQEVKPTIAVKWDYLKEKGIIDGDFYLADLLSKDNFTLKEKLFVLLQNKHYELDRLTDESGMFVSKKAEFKDNQLSHTQFWNRYERPPSEEYWDYIVERRDLLVPQDIRERKGSFFTPQKWVELSQRYFADLLGEDWQDEYYIWDCAAGTGNLLTGLTNKYHIWASTLDKQDVDVMQDRIKNGANLLESHVFQFDFLNGDFTQLPEDLKRVINNPEKRKKLIIYINPPYAEATTARTVRRTGENKSGVATSHQANIYFSTKIGPATNEIYALFMAQVYEKIGDCYLGQFSTLKFIQGTNFREFKEYFLAEYKGGFIVPSNTFDNVNGSFPIGFTIWDLDKKSKIQDIVCDVFDRDANHIGRKKFYGNLPQSINRWIVKYIDKSIKKIGLMVSTAPDFQHNSQLTILTVPQERYCFDITLNSLQKFSVYFSVRQCIKHTWINDRDQFLYPNNKWKKDIEFQNDCLAFSLFHSQNKISSKDGTNHWIPFREYEVEAKAKFESNFMTNYINAKYNSEIDKDLYKKLKLHSEPLEFSKEAQKVFSAGLELWRYYHSQDFSGLNSEKYNVNSSLYDIREYFQGRNEKGRMNSKSSDETYNQLLSNLRKRLNILAKKIEPKVYEYGFLRK